MNSICCWAADKFVAERQIYLWLDEFVDGQQINLLLGGKKVRYYAGDKFVARRGINSLLSGL